MEMKPVIGNSITVNPPMKSISSLVGFAALSKACAFAEDVISKYGKLSDEYLPAEDLVFLKALRESLEGERERQEEMLIAIRLMISRQLIIMGRMPAPVSGSTVLSSFERRVSEIMLRFRNVDRVRLEQLLRVRELISDEDRLLSLIRTDELRHDTYSEILSYADIDGLLRLAGSQSGSEAADGPLFVSSYTNSPTLLSYPSFIFSTERQEISSPSVDVNADNVYYPSGDELIFRNDTSDSADADAEKPVSGDARPYAYAEAQHIREKTGPSPYSRAEGDRYTPSHMPSDAPYTGQSAEKTSPSAEVTERSADRVVPSAESAAPTAENIEGSSADAGHTVAEAAVLTPPVPAEYRIGDELILKTEHGEDASGDASRTDAEISSRQVTYEQMTGKVISSGSTAMPTVSPVPADDTAGDSKAVIPESESSVPGASLDGAGTAAGKAYRTDGHDALDTDDGAIRPVPVDARADSAEYPGSDSLILRRESSDAAKSPDTAVVSESSQTRVTDKAITEKLYEAEREAAKLTQEKALTEQELLTERKSLTEEERLTEANLLSEQERLTGQKVLTEQRELISQSTAEEYSEPEDTPASSYTEGQPLTEAVSPIVPESTVYPAADSLILKREAAETVQASAAADAAAASDTAADTMIGRRLREAEREAARLAEEKAITEQEYLTEHNKLTEQKDFTEQTLLTEQNSSSVPAAQKPEAAGDNTEQKIPSAEAPTADNAQAETPSADTLTAENAQAENLSPIAPVTPELSEYPGSESLVYKREAADSDVAGAPKAAEPAGAPKASITAEQSGTADTAKSSVAADTSEAPGASGYAVTDRVTSAATAEVEAGTGKAVSQSEAVEQTSPGADTAGSAELSSAESVLPIVPERADHEGGESLILRREAAEAAEGPEASTAPDTRTADVAAQAEPSTDRNASSDLAGQTEVTGHALQTEAPQHQADNTDTEHPAQSAAYTASDTTTTPLIGETPPLVPERAEYAGSDSLILRRESAEAADNNSYADTADAAAASRAADTRIADSSAEASAAAVTQTVDSAEEKLQAADNAASALTEHIDTAEQTVISESAVQTVSTDADDTSAADRLYADNAATIMPERAEYPYTDDLVYKEDLTTKGEPGELSDMPASAKATSYPENTTQANPATTAGIQGDIPSREAASAREASSARGASPATDTFPTRGASTAQDTYQARESSSVSASSGTGDTVRLMMNSYLSDGARYFSQLMHRHSGHSAPSLLLREILSKLQMNTEHSRIMRAAAILNRPELADESEQSILRGVTMTVFRDNVTLSQLPGLIAEHLSDTQRTELLRTTVRELNRRDNGSGKLSAVMSFYEDRLLTLLSSRGTSMMNDVDPQLYPAARELNIYYRHTPAQRMDTQIIRLLNAAAERSTSPVKGGSNVYPSRTAGAASVDGIPHRAGGYIPGSVMRYLSITNAPTPEGSAVAGVQNADAGRSPGYPDYPEYSYYSGYSGYPLHRVSELDTVAGIRRRAMSRARIARGADSSYSGPFDAPQALAPGELTLISEAAASAADLTGQNPADIGTAQVIRTAGNAEPQIDAVNSYDGTAAALSFYEPPQTRQESAPPAPRAAQPPDTNELISRYGNLIDGADYTGANMSVTAQGDNALARGLSELSARLNKTESQAQENAELLKELQKKQSEADETTLKSKDIKKLSDEVINRLRQQMRMDRSRYINR